MNKDQKKHTAEYLNGLAVTWFSGGVISPLLIKNIVILKLIGLIIGSVFISVVLFLLGLKILKKN